MRVTTSACIACACPPWRAIIQLRFVRVGRLQVEPVLPRAAPCRRPACCRSTSSTRPPNGPRGSRRPTNRGRPKWAAHLYRRAGFGPTRASCEDAVAAGMDATVDRLFAAPKETRQPSAGCRRPAAGVNPMTGMPDATGQAAILRAAWLQRHDRRGRAAPREADAVLAQPLRHQHREGHDGAADGAAGRAAVQARPRQLPADAPGDQPRPGDARSGSTPTRTSRATRTRTTPAR